MQASSAAKSRTKSKYEALMKGYVVNLSQGSDFAGIVIMYDSIEEGLAYARANGIDKVCIKSNINDGRKKRINFDFLRGLEFIKTFHWLVPLDKRSNIDGMRALRNLEELRWVAGSHISLDLSAFEKLKSLNIQFSRTITGWEHLISLRELMLSAVDGEDLYFLRDLENLEFLRLINGRLTSIEGIDNCKHLKTLFIQNCSSLAHIKDTITKMGSLENLLIEKCKLIEPVELLQVKLNNLSIM